MKTIANRGLFGLAKQSAFACVRVRENNQKLVEEYLSWKASYTSTAVNTYRIWVERFQTLVSKSPEEFTLKDFTSFAEEVKRDYAPKAVELALNVVHNYLKFFSEQGRLTLPMYLVRVPKAVAKSHRAIEDSEFRNMIARVESTGRPSSVQTRDAAILRMLHDTGMRVGELLSLSIGDIEPEDRSAVIISEKSKTLRRIFWSEETDVVLRKQIINRQADHAAATEPLFAQPTKPGRAVLNARYVQRTIKRLAKEAGISSPVVPHSFRHAYIHRLANVGTPDAVIAQMVGHSTPLTISHYTKLSRPEMRRVAQRRFVGLAT